MHCPGRQTVKNANTTLDPTSPNANKHWAHKIRPNDSKWGSLFYSMGRQVTHLLLAATCFPKTTRQTSIQHPLNCSSSFLDSHSLINGRQHMIYAHVSFLVMMMANYQVCRRMIARKKNGMLGFIRQSSIAEAATHSQQPIGHKRTERL